MNPEEFTKTMLSKTPGWLFSKYCGMVMLTILLEIGDDNAKKVIEQWVLYGEARTPHGAPFIKIS